MKIFCHLLTVMALGAAALSIPNTASAADHLTTIGIESGYVSRNTSAYAGVYMRYQFSDFFALKPHVDFVIRNKEQDAFIVNFDGQFSLPIHAEKLNVYGIAGIGFSSWNIKELNDEGELDMRRHGGIGFDLGAGVGYNVSSSLRLALEAKANMVKHYTTALVGVSIGYNF